MLVKLCAGNYATYDGLVNGAYGIFEALTTYCEKTIIWIKFQNYKIGTLTKYIYVNIMITTLNQNRHQLNLSSKI
jgi:hypothetical protein